MASFPFDDDEQSTTRTVRAQYKRSPIELRWTDAGGTHRVTVEDDVELGCSPGVSVTLSDPSVSRLHARIEQRDDGPWIVDLGSTNGMKVDGLAVTGARLRDGARVSLGEVQVTVGFGQEKVHDVWPLESFGPLVGRSIALRRTFALLDRYARTEGTVLVTGETGTGKEEVARAIHLASARAKGPFIVVDCGAIPEALIESELFGHARGAFSGADRARDGSFGAADGGTLFLDEVGELPLAAQPKLLRALESRTVKRVGEAQHRPVDVRVIAATHRDLAQMVAVGGFREDLYFRLAVLPVTIAPLRERREDISALVERFRGEPFDSDVTHEIMTRPWLGNARELRNFVERARAIGPREALESLPGPAAPRRVPSVDLDEPFKDARERCLSHLERMYLEGLLERQRWNVSAVAEAMGLDRSHVHRLLKKHGLQRDA